MGSAQCVDMDKPYIKVYEGTAYDGRKYYVSYVNIEELDPLVQEAFTEYQTCAAIPIIPGYSNVAYSYDYERFLLSGNI